MSKLDILLLFTKKTNNNEIKPVDNETLVIFSYEIDNYYIVIFSSFESKSAIIELLTLGITKKLLTNQINVVK